MKHSFSAITATAILALGTLAACGPPAAVEVAEWDDKRHEITAHIGPGSGIGGVKYTVTIDGETVIAQDIPRSKQRSQDGTLSATATGTFEGDKVEATFKQTPGFNQTFFRHEIRVADELVAAITP